MAAVNLTTKLVIDKHYIISMAFAMKQDKSALESSIASPLGITSRVLLEEKRSTTNAPTGVIMPYWIYSLSAEPNIADVTPRMIKDAAGASAIATNGPVDSKLEKAEDLVDYIEGTAGQPYQWISGDEVLLANHIYMVGARWASKAPSLTILTDMLDNGDLRLTLADTIRSSGNNTLLFFVATKSEMTTPLKIKALLNAQTTLVMLPPFASPPIAKLLLGSDIMASSMESLVSDLINSTESISKTLSDTGGANWMKIGIAGALLLGGGYLYLRYIRKPRRSI